VAVLRVNKRERRKYRKWAAEYTERAERTDPHNQPEIDQLQRIAGMWKKLGSPMKSRKRRASSDPKKSN
jgi:hypothetical protein